VLKNALRLYEALIKEAEEGNELAIRRRSGERVETKVFL
jgi:hypothetical protein